MRPALPPGPFLVVGLARSGAAAARLLIDRGEKVLAVDSGRPDVDFPASLGSDGLALLPQAGTIVKSPGVPQEAPVIAAAREAGVPLIGELELAWRLLPNPFVAVTGTNGKTTTTELLGAIWPDSVTAGNVGRPLSSLVDKLDPATTVICECSSFQLEDSVEFAPDVAILLNIEEDHLDRHHTMEAYRDAKLRVFVNQTRGDLAVLPAGFGAIPGAAMRIEYDGVELPDDIRMRGEHNRRNAQAAAAAALARGVPAETVDEGLRTFAGVPHRLEEVADRGGVLYVNDSKATNVASAAVGIAAFEGGVHVILGGSLKGGGFTGLREVVADRCKAAYLIGEAAPRLHADLDGTVPLHDCGDLDRAVAAAREAAVPGDVILLSPACASYDQFKNYEERGERFRQLAE